MPARSSLDPCFNFPKVHCSFGGILVEVNPLPLTTNPSTTIHLLIDFLVRSIILWYSAGLAALGV